MNEEVLRILREDLMRKKTPEEEAERAKFREEVLNRLVQFGNDTDEMQTRPTDKSQ